MARIDTDKPLSASPTPIMQIVSEKPLGAVGRVVVPVETEDPEVVRLYSTSEEYSANYDHWMFLVKAYEGGPTYVGTDTLFKHQRETQEDFQDRLSRATYWNFSSCLNDYVPEFIFSQPVERTPAAGLRPWFERFEHNVDRAGTHIDQFMRSAVENARLFGKVWIGVDKPKLNVDPKVELSVQQVRDLGGELPYWYQVLPIEVLDFHVDDMGNYLYLKRLRHIRVMVSLGSFEDVDEFTEWTPEIVRVTHVIEKPGSDGQKRRFVKDASEVPNPAKEIPLVPIYHRRSKMARDYGISFLQDIAYQNRQVFNLTSLIDEFLFRQAFNILAMEVSTRVPSQGDNEKLIGTSNVLEVPEGAKNMPAYVSPPVGPAKFIQDERRLLIQEMYRQAAQDLGQQMLGQSSGETPSGDSARQQFGRTVPVIARMADSCQEAETKLFVLWSRLLGKDWKGSKIGYRDDYSIQNMMSLILELSGIMNSLKLLSPTFIKEEWKRIVREFDGRISRAKMEEIFTEIDELDEEKLLELYKSKAADKPAEGQPSAANLMQGEMQSATGTDARRSGLTGDKSNTKETIPDKNKQTKSGKTVKGG